MITTVVRQRGTVEKTKSTNNDPPATSRFLSSNPHSSSNNDINHHDNNNNKGKRLFQGWAALKKSSQKSTTTNTSQRSLAIPMTMFILLSIALVLTSPSDHSTFGYLVGSNNNNILYDGPPRDLVVHGKRDYYTPCPPEFRKKVWTGELSDSHIPRAFRYLGWSLIEEEAALHKGEYHILYKRRAGKTGVAFSIGKPYQRFSRLPNSFEMESKDGFLAGFRGLQNRYDQQHPTDYGKHDQTYFLPETYRLTQKTDVMLFEATLKYDKEHGRNRPWVLKKVKVNNGKGIEMLPPDSPALYSAVGRSAADKDNDYVIQAYICNELTWFGKEKFDLRFYWMVASVDPLIVLYHDGYVRVGGAAYNESDWESTGQHLTNHAFRAYRGEVDEDVLADALWRRVREHYEANKGRLSKIIKGNDPVRHVRNQMKEAIGATAEAFKETLTLASPNTPNVTTENLFALYGADFIIDDDLDVYYVEAQTAPGLGTSYDFRIELFRTLFRPMISIVEEIAVKQEADAKENILPIESLGDYEIVYAGDWRYQYKGYKRSNEKRGCQLSSSAEQWATKNN